MLRIIKVWFKWRKDWDSLCNRCGKCCYIRSVDSKKNVIIHYNCPCENLDTKTNLCKIYNERLRKCNHCGKVNLFTALFNPTLPNDCAYVQAFRLWKKQSGNKK